jgi:hypothetical protein
MQLSDLFQPNDYIRPVILFNVSLGLHFPVDP